MTTVSDGADAVKRGATSRRADHPPRITCPDCGGTGEVPGRSPFGTWTPERKAYIRAPMILPCYRCDSRGTIRQEAAR